jgi:hypothetical protein
MKQLKALLVMALLLLVSGNMFAPSHREAPITASTEAPTLLTGTRS